MDQIHRAGRCALVLLIPLFGLYRICCFQQHPIHNAERLNRVCLVHSADNQAASSFQALSSSVATALGLTHPSPSATVFIDVESVAPKVFSIDAIVAQLSPTFRHAPYLSIAVPVRKCANSSTIERSPQKHYLNTSNAPATVAVRKENDLNITEATEMPHLLIDSVAA